LACGEGEATCLIAYHGHGNRSAYLLRAHQNTFHGPFGLGSYGSSQHHGLRSFQQCGSAYENAEANES
jgi:hypothetical protein